MGTPKKRLPISHARGVAEWKSSPALWAKLAAALGRSELEPDARDQIDKIAHRYIGNEPFSKNAPRVKDAIEWLDNIEKALLNMATAYTSSGGGGAKVYAESLLDEDLAKAGFARFQNLLEHGSAARRAITITRFDICSEGHPGFRENGAWLEMIVQLWELADTSGWKPSTNSEKAERGGPTPFVAFVDAFQKSLRAELRLHGHSVASLNEAVKKATKPCRKTNPAS